MFKRQNLFWAIVTTMTIFSLSSCNNDDEEEDNANKPSYQQNDDEKGNSGNKKDSTTVTIKGTFTITNKCTGEEIVTTTDMFDQDTLCIEFEPEEKYKAQQFTISCEELSSLGNGFFVLKNRTSSPTSLLISAICKSEATQYIANKAIDVNVSHTYAVVPFWLLASQDLLLLSTAQVTYTDADGREHSFDIKDEDWERPDSIILYTFQDSEGFEHYEENKAEGLEKGWTLKEEEKLGPNATYSFDVRYYHLDIDASVTVRYKRKDGVSATADSYYLYHTIDRNSAKITIPGITVIDQYNHINLDLTDHDVSKSALDKYFNNLNSSTDTFKLNISNGGTITKRQ